MVMPSTDLGRVLHSPSSFLSYQLSILPEGREGRNRDFFFYTREKRKKKKLSFLLWWCRFKALGL